MDPLQIIALGLGQLVVIGLAYWAGRRSGFVSGLMEYGKQVPRDVGWLGSTREFVPRPRESGDRFDKFTERARRVLGSAQREAEEHACMYIGTEHLLLGLIDESEGLASKVLTNLGLDVVRVRATTEALLANGEQFEVSLTGLTPQAKIVIELAVDEARRLNHHFIGTEHLLIGLIREHNGIGASVLERFDISLGKVRVETVKMLNQSSETREDSP